MSEAEILQAVSQRVTEFASRLAYYIETRPPNQGIQKFVPWPWQVGLLSAWQRGGDHVVLKARQLGVSWLLSIYCLWMAMFTPGANIVMLSINQDRANMLIRRMKLIYSRLPPWLREAIPTDQWSTSTLSFITRDGQPRGTVQAFPSTESAGRSEAVTLVVCDEWAFHPFAEVNYTAFRQSGGNVVGVSTANGAAGLFWRTFIAAVRGGAFRPHFVSWRQHPNQDDAWYTKKLDDMTAVLGWEQGRMKMSQEHPNTWQEAFVTTGACVFDTITLHRMLQEPETLPVYTENIENGLWQVWRYPVVGTLYVAGVDVAEGLADGDFSGMAIHEAKSGLHVADLHGHWEPNRFAQLCDTFGKMYYRAYMGVERNGPGLAVLGKLEDLHYPNIHIDVRTSARGDKTTMKAGWSTTASSKPMMIADFGEALVTGSFRTFDKAMISECLTYTRKVSPSGYAKIGASEGAFDDRVVKNMIARQMWEFALAAPQAGFNARPYNVDDVRRDRYPEGIRGGSGRIEADLREAQRRRSYTYNVDDLRERI